MSTISAPAFTATLNTSVVLGNPLCASAADLTIVTAQQLIQVDTAYLNLYFAAAGAGGIGSTPVNMRIAIASGVSITYAGKPADDLAATTVLFLATGFTEKQDTAGNYFYQAIIALNTTEIAAQFTALGDGVNSLACLVDIDLSVPAAGGVPALLGTFQIQVTLLRKVYLGTESTPTPATPTYPAGASVQALLTALLAAIGGVFNLAAADGAIFPVLLSGSDAAPELAVFPAGTFVPAFSFPAGTSGQAILRNQSTGSAFPLVLQGSDAAPVFAVLPRGSAIPAITYQLAANGQLSLLNQTTGSFLPVVIGGTDAAPALEIIPAA